MKAPPVYLFQANSGVLIETPNKLRPTFFFEVFLNHEDIEFFVAETNSYAVKVWQNMFIKRISRFRKMGNVTEMGVFIGLVLHMRAINLLRLSDYWSNDPMYKTLVQQVHEPISLLFAPPFWHFEINGTNERLNKLRFLMNRLNNTMKRIYCPTENLSLDESMVLWRGRLIFHQYVKEKKHKYGKKFYNCVNWTG